MLWSDVNENSFAFDTYTNEPSVGPVMYFLFSTNNFSTWGARRACTPDTECLMRRFVNVGITVKVYKLHAVLETTCQMKPVPFQFGLCCDHCRNKKTQRGINRNFHREIKYCGMKWQKIQIFRQLGADKNGMSLYECVTYTNAYSDRTSQWTIWIRRDNILKKNIRSWELRDVER